MAEVFVEFTEPVVADGIAYTARACGGPMTDGLWEAWLEFTPLDGDPVLQSSRETTQPNRGDTIYWATGLTPVYLEGALQRALRGHTAAPLGGPPAFDGPAPEIEGPRPSHPILDPFAVIRRGESQLRQQLEALSGWHLATIVRGYGLSSLPESRLSTLSRPALVDLIVATVKDEARISGKR